MRHNTNIRIYTTHPLKQGSSIILDKDQSHYLATVMRQKVGANFLIFNGQDGEWLAEITDTNKRAVTVQILDQTKMQQPEPDLWFAFAPIKKARLDFIAQKVTELGVSHIIPVLTRRTIVDRVKTERMYANAVEAAEQCERLNVPTIGDVTKLETFIEEWPEDRMLMFCDEDLSGDSAYTVLKKSSIGASHSKWGILIGPEGGFDEHERAMIKNLPNSVVVSLGPRILRADTAALSAITLWQSSIGDWV